MEEDEALIMARYIIESSEPGADVAYDDERKLTQLDLINRMQHLLGDWEVFTPSLEKSLTTKIVAILEGCTETLEIAIKCEDDKEDGYIHLKH